MVAIRLSEVAGKGWEWFSGGQAPQGSAVPQAPAPAHAPSPSSSSPSYWNYAQDSLQQAADQTYSTVAGVVYSVYPGSDHGGDDPLETPVMENLPARNSTTNSLLTSPALLNMFHNPYVSIRGGRRQQAFPPSQSMEAVRSLLSVVPASTGMVSPDQMSLETSSSHGDSLEGSTENKTSWITSLMDRGTSRPSSQQGTAAPINSSTSETASQLAEGTLRAFRDIALDEAVELHGALRFWSYRWERPLLSWLEAGPTVWFSEEGYRHQVIGQKVSQIQAVLARRCATIGDLQQHLLQAGWQRGVAQWGVLGDGGEWAAVAGNDGSMPQDMTNGPQKLLRKATPFRRVSSELLVEGTVPPPPRHELPRQAPTSNVSNLPQRSQHNALYYTNVFVTRNHGGQIYIDDPALAEWSVDAMSIVRRLLYRAANGFVILPYSENWAEGDDQSLSYYDVTDSLDSESQTESATDEGVVPPKLPLWASLSPHNMAPVEEEEEVLDVMADGQKEETTNVQRVTISDLPLMVSEVSELLDVMESIMDLQRGRRLEKLKPPFWMRQNWYVGAIVLPPLTYLCYNMAVKGFGWGFLKYTSQKLLDFCREHVVEPFLAMYDEFTKGTEDISDRKARDTAIVNLQKMIRSWLDETQPDMPVEERAQRAQAMDISLIEAMKEENMKTIYELNSVIRMSFIEAQFIKKEMMNALLALDEMRASTNFNLNLAAVTPFVLLVWGAKRSFQFVYYAMLKMGKSKEETYGSFLHVLTEIERLLVMRDNPPTPPPTSTGFAKHNVIEASSQLGSNSVLNSDDLGMLMLQIHELRTILWRDRRRFAPDVIRSVAEDLAELAGERGAVSVRQQLQIIGRMCRTYPFLKVASSRVIFEHWQR